MMMKKYVKLHKCKLQQDEESSQGPKLMEEDHHHHCHRHHQYQSHRETNIDVVTGDAKEVVRPHTPRSTKLMDAMRKLIVQRQPSSFAPKNKNNNTNLRAVAVVAGAYSNCVPSNIL
ncbi:hypothetical protein ACFX11_028448 [Malus domestica]